MINAELNVEVIIHRDRVFERRDQNGSGFAFPCDEQGNPVNLKPYGQENYNKCISGEYDVEDKGIRTWRQEIRLCSCGSLKHYEDIHDARGIFVARVCEVCKREKLSKYRPEIFTDSNYECNEQIEDDY